eukprot:TRINITY_DN5584_c0_g1_i1.p1 TRINITY_DN5584_c0_g1~~TRINITY_DN5584_c0_g1_i1.p1  ORF type:complete len:271 (+),score=59.86 TRINITY_DN5584_c0_g1_i1:56-868(+)
MAQQSTPLHKAALKGLFEAVKILAERGAQLDAEDEAGYTALQISAFQGFDKIVGLLLSRGASVNHQDQNGDGYTALQLASQEGHINVIDTLLCNGADVDTQNETGDTALHLAVRNGHAKAVALLLQAGASLHVEDDEGETVLTAPTTDEIRAMLANPPSPLSPVPSSPLKSVATAISTPVPTSEADISTSKATTAVLGAMNEVDVLKAQLYRAKQVGDIAQKEVLKLRERAQTAEARLATSQALVEELRRQLALATTAVNDDGTATEANT